QRLRVRHPGHRPGRRLQPQGHRGPGLDQVLPGGVLDEPAAERRLRLQDAAGDAALPPPPRLSTQGRDLPAVTSGSWLDPTGLRFAVGFAILAALANGVWILLDHTSPSWDQAFYLTDTFQYRVGFAGDGVHGLLSAIHSTDPAKGPLFT